MNVDQNKAEEGQPIDKVWGKTRCLVRRHDFEVHYLQIVAGGYCSRHRHNAKWNQFFVVSGKLRVRCFNPNGESDYVQTLGPGEILLVAPGRLHRFEAPEDCEAMETYWTDPVDPYDIERIDQGGITPGEELHCADYGLEKLIQHQTRGG